MLQRMLLMAFLPAIKRIVIKVLCGLGLLTDFDQSDSATETGPLQQGVELMVCSNCGNIISRKEQGYLFDIYEKTWLCSHCGHVWTPVANWQVIGKLLIPVSQSI